MNISMIGIDHNMAPVDIRALFACAGRYQTPPSELTERYFGNLDMYFED